MRGWGAWTGRLGRGGRDEATPDPSSAGTGAEVAALTARDGRRSDIEGLRGVAIVLVVLYHSGLPLAGGYVGVDVFFVISGFLITGLLLRELERTGSINLPAFYARRVRRLLPAAAVALTATALWSAVALSPLDQPSVMADARAAALSVANLRFALDGFDYFDLGHAPSPFIHYWSLSVEEQFYVVWPGLLLAVAWAAKRLGRQRAGRAGGTALAVIAVTGLAASVALTELAPTWGFYTLPARAWEFAIGGLIALGTPALQRLRRRIGSVIGWLAAALLLASAVGLDASVPYPGIAAVLPTAAAAGLIVAGSRGGLDRALGVAPLRFLGRISYSLYLWHWPFIVLPAAMTGAMLDLPASLALIGIAIVVSWLSRRLIEVPFLGISGVRPHLTRATLQLGAATLLLVLAVSGGLHALAVNEVARAGTDNSSPLAASRTGEAALNADAADDAGPVIDGSGAQVPDLPGRPAAPATSPTPPPSPTSPPQASRVLWTDIGRASLRADVSLPAGVRPSLATARSDEERLIGDGCFTWPDGTVPASCIYGDRHGKVTVALIGDSHASAWFPALNVLANRNGWRLLPFAKASCPFLDAPVFHPLAERRYTECETWRARAIAAVNAAQPDLVIVAEAFYPANTPINPDDQPLRARGRAMADAIGQLRATKVAIMVDNPRTGVDVPACLARYPHDVNRCAIPRSVAFPSSFGVVERVAAAASGATVIDIVASICPSTPCAVVRGGMILYRDGHHLTATFSRSLAGPLGAAIAPLLPESPSSAPSPSPAPTVSALPTAAPVLAPSVEPSS